MCGAPTAYRPPLATRRLAAAALAFLALLLVSLAPAGAQTFPALTGRVVDQAGVIPADKRSAIEAKLADLEAKSGIQLVVATVKSLEGQEIEPYANALFRSWKLGEKQRNNGVLLLVAPNEHRVRIEVGYGLEATLTDALSKVIISNAVAPKFKAGDFGAGVDSGVDDIVTVLTTDSSEWQKRPSLRLDAPDGNQVSNTTLAIALFCFVALLLFCRTCREIFFQVVWSVALSSGSSGGRGGYAGGGGFSSGGGFSGGGGSSGGGGASGSW